MRLSTIKGMAAGGLLGMTVATGIMMTPQGKRMRKVLSRNGTQVAKQLAECWSR